MLKGVKHFMPIDTVAVSQFPIINVYLLYWNNERFTSLG